MTAEATGALGERAIVDALSALPYPIVVHNRDGVPLFATQRAALLLGFERSAEVTTSPPSILGEITVTTPDGSEVALLEVPRQLSERSEVVLLRDRQGRSRSVAVRVTHATASGSGITATLWDDAPAVHGPADGGESGAATAQLLASAGSRLLRAADDPEDLIEGVAELFVPFLGDSCTIDLVDDEGRIDLALVRTAPGAEPPDPDRRRAVVAEAIAQRRSLVIPPEAPTRADGSLRNLVVVPLEARGHVVGAITVSSSSARGYDEAWIRVAEDFATSAALAVDNARLLEAERMVRREIERATTRLSYLLETSSALAASLDLGQALSKLADVLVSGLADVVMIDVLMHDGSIQRMATAHADPAEQDLARRLGLYSPRPGSRNPAARVIQSSRPEWTPDVDEGVISRAVQDEGHRKVAEALHPVSYICVPLVARRRVLGAVTMITTHSSGRRYTESDVALADALAQRAAIEIDNTRLYQEANEASRVLQHSLLPPSLPELPEADVAVRYRPAGRYSQVGGDWYDAFALPGGALAVVVGDVVGKGMSAAATMGQLRMVVRAYALEDPAPAAVVGRLQRLMRILSGSHMATLIYGVYDPGSLTLRYVRAGHPPPLLLVGGRSRYLDGGLTVPLGVPDDEASEAEARLDPGATVLLYTDGLIEHRKVPIDAGLRALEDVAARLNSGSLEELCGGIEAALLGEGGLDDAALLAFRPRRRD